MAGLTQLAKFIAMKHAGKALPKAVHTRKSIPSGSTIVKSKKEAAPRQTGSERLEEEILKSEGAWVEDDYIPILGEHDVPATPQIHMSESDIVDVGPILEKTKALAALKNIDEGEAFTQVLEESFASSILKTPKKSKPSPKAKGKRSHIQEIEVRETAESYLNPTTIKDKIRESTDDNLKKFRGYGRVGSRGKEIPTVETSEFKELVSSIFNARDPQVYITNSPSKRLVEGGRNQKSVLEDVVRNTMYPLKGGENIIKLRIQAQKLLEESLSKKEAKKIIGESDGLPTILFHSTMSKEPFPTFDKKQIKESGKKEGHYGHDFLSTSTDPRVIKIFGLQREIVDIEPELWEKYFKIAAKIKKESESVPGTVYGRNIVSDEEREWFKRIEKDLERGRGARTIIGVGKVKKLFDFNKDKDRDALLKYLKEKNPVFDVRKSKTERYNDLSEKEKDTFNFDLSRGRWRALESPNIKEAIQKLGYDAFTTIEAGGKNVMLFHPDKQFIPVFDPKMKSTIGFNMGGSIKTNPYLRGLV